MSSFASRVCVRLPAYHGADSPASLFPPLSQLPADFAVASGLAAAFDCLREQGVECDLSVATADDLLTWSQQCIEQGGTMPLLRESLDTIVSTCQLWQGRSLSDTSITGRLLDVRNPAPPSSHRDIRSLEFLMSHPEGRVAHAALSAVRCLDTESSHEEAGLTTAEWQRICTAFQRIRGDILRMTPMPPTSLRRLGVQHVSVWWSPLVAAVYAPLRGREEKMDVIQEDFVMPALDAIVNSPYLAEAALDSTPSAIWDHTHWRRAIAEYLPAPNRSVLHWLIHEDADASYRLIRRQVLPAGVVLETIAASAMTVQHEGFRHWALRSIVAQCATQPEPIEVSPTWASVLEDISRSLHASGPVLHQILMPPPLPLLRPLAVATRSQSGLGGLPEPDRQSDVLTTADAAETQLLLNLLQHKTFDLAAWMIAQCQSPRRVPTTPVLETPDHPRPIGWEWDAWMMLMHTLSQYLPTVSEWARVVQSVMELGPRSPRLPGIMANRETVGGRLFSLLICGPVPRELGGFTADLCRPFLMDSRKPVREIGLRLLGRLHSSAPKEDGVSAVLGDDEMRATPPPPMDQAF